MSEKTTPAPAMKVGDRVALVSRRFERLICETTITRETPRFWWVGDIRYRKPTGAAFSDYAHEDRAIVPLNSVMVLPAKPDASEAAARKRAVDGLIADMQAPEIRTAPIGPITAEDLAEIDRLHREATPGPWTHRTEQDSRETWHTIRADRAFVVQAGGFMVTKDGESEEHYGVVMGARDAAFIAGSRTLLPRLALAYRATVDAHRETIAQRDALAAKVESLIAQTDALEGLVKTMIAEADAHRDGVKTDRSSTAALASERLWAAANEAREALKKARR